MLEDDPPKMDDDKLLSYRISNSQCFSKRVQYCHNNTLTLDSIHCRPGLWQMCVVVFGAM